MKKQDEFKVKMIMQIFFFVLFLIFCGTIKWHGFEMKQMKSYVIENKQNLKYVNEKVYNIQQENESLKQMIIETSDIPNEKRKAIFELKTKQDSILIDMLMNDIRTNKQILNLLETDWEFNNDTEFETLKTK